MTTFGLVHGAFHGGWCWGPLADELGARGHRSVAMDLPCDDPSAGNVRYADVVVEALASSVGGDDDVVVVGHSLAGLTIPLVAARRGVRRLVYLCAFVPQPGRSFVEWSSEEADLYPPGTEDIWPVRDPDGLMSWPADRAVRALYPDCPAETARQAARQLRRQTLTPHQEPFPLDELPEVAVSIIYGRDDKAIAAPWLQRVAVERFGTEAHQLPGGHSPFLARPAAVADLLVDLSHGD